LPFWKYSTQACPATGFSTNKPRIISHVQQLSPRPESEVLAIALSSLFKILRRLPVVPFAKQFLIGHVFAGEQKIAHIADYAALDR
jgi:hypothetical protein